MISRFEHFNASIYGIYRDILKIERAAMVKHGLKGSYALYLTAIARHPDGLTATQLCEICDKDKAAVSRVITELEQKGLVARIRHNETSYRARLSLTDKGQAIAREVAELAQVAVNKATVGMSEENRSIMYECLGLIATNLRTICKEGISVDE